MTFFWYTNSFKKLESNSAYQVFGRKTGLWATAGTDSESALRSTSMRALMMIVAFFFASAAHATPTYVVVDNSKSVEANRAFNKAEAQRLASIKAAKAAQIKAEAAAALVQVKEASKLARQEEAVEAPRLRSALRETVAFQPTAPKQEHDLSGMPNFLD